MKIAFRIDDVSPYMCWESFERLTALFTSHGVKPLLGVIPDNQDPELRRYPFKPSGWDEIRALRDWGWSISQHGSRHAYTTTKSGLLGINNYSEFAGLDYDTQYGLLQEGRRALEQEGLATDIFMAPAHSFDAVTLKALTALDFHNVSDGYSVFPYRRGGLKFIPCQSSKPSALPVGLMTVCLHPNTFTENDFKAVESWLKLYKNRIIPYSAAIDAPARGPFARASETAVLLTRRARKSILGVRH